MVVLPAFWWIAERNTFLIFSSLWLFLSPFVKCLLVGSFGMAAGYGAVTFSLFTLSDLCFKNSFRS